MCSLAVSFLGSVVDDDRDDGSLVLPKKSSPPIPPSMSPQASPSSSAVSGSGKNESPLPTPPEEEVRDRGAEVAGGDFNA